MHAEASATEQSELIAKNTHAPVADAIPTRGQKQATEPKKELMEGKARTPAAAETTKLAIKQTTEPTQEKTQKENRTELTKKLKTQLYQRDPN